MRCQPILNCYYYISKNHVNQFVLCPIKFWTHEKQQWDLMCSSNWKIKYLNIQNITSSFSIQSGWNKLDLVVFLSSRLGLGWLFFVLTVHFLASPDFEFLLGYENTFVQQLLGHFGFSRIFWTLDNWRFDFFSKALIVKVLNIN